MDHSKTDEKTNMSSKNNYKKIFDWVKRNPIRTRIHELWTCHYVSLTLNLKFGIEKKSSWPSWSCNRQLQECKTMKTQESNNAVLWFPFKKSISCYECQVQVLQPWGCYLCTNASLWGKFCTGVSIKEKMEAWYNNFET